MSEPTLPGPPSPGPTPTPIPAATVVLLRPTASGPEVLLTRRPATMAFGPDIHVFPGGRVDAGDRDERRVATAGLTSDEAGRRLGLGLAPDPQMTATRALAHHVAAARETAEETGIEIAARDLIALTRWVTPASMPRRFDVRFFAAFVPSGTEIVTASAEVVSATWLSPRAALDAAAEGRIELWQPTFVTLQQLDSLRDEAAVLEAFAPGSDPGGPTFEPLEPGVVRLDAPWAGGIPGRRSRGWLVGRREIVVVDPGDPTGVTTDAIQEYVARVGGRLVGILVTHRAPARHAGVEMLAHGLGLPVCAPWAVAAASPYPTEGLEPGTPVPFGDVAFTLDAVSSFP